MKIKLKDQLECIILVVLGNIFIFLGLSRGKEWALFLTKPKDLNKEWLTSDELIRACTYSPVVFGGTLIVFALIIISIKFSKSK